MPARVDRARGARGPLALRLAGTPERCMLDDRVGAGRAGFVAHTRARGVLAIVLARDRSLGAIEYERACTASRTTTGAQLGSG
jgi:hypothetical protein